MADLSKLSFVELMKQQPSYGPLMDTLVTYQLTALYNGTYWSLAIKGDHPDLPYVTIELISDDGKTIVRAVRKVDYTEDELSQISEQVGTYGPDEMLRALCQLADETYREDYNNKLQEFTPRLLAKLGFHKDLPTMTTTYYTIEVVFGSGFMTCYLGTQNNDMRFDPAFPDKNLSVYWKCDPEVVETNIQNYVTEYSSPSTYMHLGMSISTRPDTYVVTLNGPEKNFYFMNSKDLYDVYAIATMARDGSMTYLKPQNGGEIVAVAQTPVPFLFRLTRTTLPIPPTSMWNRESKAQQLHLQSHL